MGLLGGIALDHILVQFPARRKIGMSAFADFKRAADTGNGLYLYPALAMGGFALTLAAAVLASAGQMPYLLLATVLGIGVLVTTAFAAPMMLRISKIPNSDKAVPELMERFIRYSYVRAAFIWADAIVLLYALLSLR